MTYLLQRELPAELREVAHYRMSEFGEPKYVDALRRDVYYGIGVMNLNLHDDLFRVTYRVAGGV